jgi:hypothetical protein
MQRIRAEGAVKYPAIHLRGEISIRDFRQAIELTFEDPRR